MTVSRRRVHVLSGAVALGLVWIVACAPTAAPSPTTAPPKPAATVAPTPRPAATTAPATQPKTPPAATPAAKPTASAEQAVADFYRGKTVRIVVGFGPGAAFDLFARLVARHMPRYLAGSPTIIVENKPGASGILAANTVYNTEPKDGTVILVTNEFNVLLQAVEAEGIQFDAARFNWLGAAIKGAYVCAGRTDAGFNSIEDLMKGVPLSLGSTGLGTSSYAVPSVLNATLGTKIKLVPGYADFTKVKLAIEGKEVDGACGGWDGVVQSFGDLLEGDKPTLKTFISLGSLTPDAAAQPALKAVPVAETLAKTDEARELIRAVNVPAQMNKPFAVAPEVPRERVEALRRAVAQAFADAQFLAEAKQSQLFVNFNPGQEVERVVREVVSMPAATREKLKAMVK